jgi:hypothetical protein
MVIQQSIARKYFSFYHSSASIQLANSVTFSTATRDLINLKPRSQKNESVQSRDLGMTSELAHLLPEHRHDRSSSKWWLFRAARMIREPKRWLFGG